MEGEVKLESLDRAGSKNKKSLEMRESERIDGTKLLIFGL